MKLGNTCLSIFLLVLALGNSGCHRDKEQQLESKSPEMVLPPLTENERIVKDAIRDIVLQGGMHSPKDGSAMIPLGNGQGGRSMAKAPTFMSIGRGRPPKSGSASWNGL